MSFPQNNMNQGQIKEEESQIRDNEKQFQKFENTKWVNEWVNLETSERRNEYYPVKQILAVSPIKIAVKLLKLNFREEFEEMKKYNEILLPFRCRFEFLGAGFGRINRLTEFIGNALVVKKADHNSRYHMIHVRKRKIEEQTFQECEMLRKFEGDFFVYFQYILHKDKQEPKSCGRKNGVKIINKI